VPLPASLAKFRGLVPIVAGIALGASKFGRKGLGSQLALGMIVAGGLAMGRQYAPNVFSGEDEMLGLPMIEPESLGLTYQAGESDDQFGANEPESVEGEGEELFGEFITSAQF